MDLTERAALRKSHKGLCMAIIQKDWEYEYLTSLIKVRNFVPPAYLNQIQQTLG